MEQILLTDLITKVKQIISTFDYKPSTIRHYYHHWDSLSNYFFDKGHVFFSVATSNDFLAVKETEMNAGAISASNMRMIRRTIHFLQDYYIKGDNITWNRIQRSIPKLNDAPAFVALLVDYKSNISSTLQESSVMQYCRIVETFLLYIKKCGFTDFGDVDRETVKDSINHLALSNPKGIHVVLPALRSFIRFLSEDNDSLSHLLWAIPQNACYQPPLISIISEKELSKMDSYIRTEGLSPERDYAIFLLAARLALRKSDIAALTLDDIDWRNGSLTIIQKKTSKPLTLPILNDVGNALSEYILNKRPPSSDRHIFIRNMAPYLGINSNVCCNIIRRAMEHCGIRKREGMSSGIHCLRHYVAHRMLSESGTLPIISSILGHSDKESTKRYLSVDIDKLRLCSLSLQGIEVQKEELL